MNKYIKLTIISTFMLFLSGCAQISDLTNPPESGNRESTESEKDAVAAQRQQRLQQLYEGRAVPVVEQDSIEEDDDIFEIVNEGTRVFVTITTEGTNPSGRLNISVSDVIEWTNNYGDLVEIALESGNALRPLFEEELEDGARLAFQFKEAGEYSFSVDAGDFTGSITVE